MIRRPTFPLERVRELIAANRYVITASANQSSVELGLCEDDVIGTVLDLVGANFHKSMASQKSPGQWQDVYRSRCRGIPVYVKVQILSVESSNEKLVVISFKRL